MKVLLLIFLISTSIYAKIETVPLSPEKKVTFDLPEKWEYVKELFGIPLSVLGPWEEEARPVLMIIPTGVTSTELPVEEFQKIFNDFKKEKEEWVQERGGTLTKFEPVTAYQSQGAKGFYIGADYAFDGGQFSERSFYVQCKNELYNVKWSIQESQRKYLPDLQKIVGSLRCE